MFGKHFASMYEGSMYGAGCAVFAVWGYAISHAMNSRVELNPIKLAHTLGGAEKEIKTAIEFLEKPDPKSRNKDHQGRKMVKEGEFQYFLPSWAYYRAMKSAEDRRAYNAQKQAEYRAKKKGKNAGKPLAGEQAYEKALERGDEGAAQAIVENGLPDAVVDKADQVSPVSVPADPADDRPGHFEAGKWVLD